MIFQVVIVALAAVISCQQMYTVSFNNYGCSAGSSSANDLAAIKTRGFLRCGTSDSDSIFGITQGSDRVGVNAAFCKAVAAAIFGDASKVVFTTVDSTSRWTVIPNNLVDIVAYTSTKTASRVLTYGVRFTPIIFYDYTGVATKKTTGVTTTDQLATKGTAAAPVTVCTTTGSTTGTVIAAFGAGKNILVDSTRNTADLYSAFAAGTCQYIADDTTPLTARINTTNDVILTGQNLGSLALQPLAAFTAAENKALGGIAEVVLNGLFLAELKGVTKANAAANNDVYAPEVGTVAGLSTTFMTDVIKAVGNYGEIYAQFIQSKIARSGFNNLYTTSGGLHYAYNS